MKPDTPPTAAAQQRAHGAPPHEHDAGDEHDLGLIVERLGWTPEQRLDANTAFLRFYLSVCPEGPLITGDR